MISDPTSAINPQPHVHDPLRPDQPLYLVDTGASAINPQPHVHDPLRPDQPLYLVDTGASASILGINMLSDEEKRSMQDPAVDPVQVLAVNGDDIKV